MTTTVLLATHNRKKLDELRRILRPLVPDVKVLGLDDVPPYAEPAETEPTFEGNARLKAQAAVRHTNLPSLADDSGLCVDAMNGMPGVLSARWAGRQPGRPREYELLLDQLADVPDERRGAAFVASVVLVLPDGTEHVAEGRLTGRIAREPRGQGGFGYDPVFIPDGESRTLAEMTPEEKDAISHRGRALRRIAPILAKAAAERARG
ncbi:RdgB/HAM1 family non-canonical purine NTP pyrophosphatase [Thermasporomyces composti]|uniref:dITP/XTP pyrophosphatase n=1 Tax=Thermasporomyces composti TaxID=696763 RepID=A0A3D9VET9_THECX|nr:RdgB/HAM1 family non-canonical purine NTP pyrophosphatase [Thermasporomyces composti]REF37655.1 XTP/dITP diphosphohydrolase [Thermasporomyces composti]